MRRARRADPNQPEIVKAFRDCGCSVEVISDLGRGVPDLLVGIRGRTFLVEVKVGREPLTPTQSAWREKWRGNYAVVTTKDEALQLCGTAP